MRNTLSLIFLTTAIAFSSCNKEDVKKLGCIDVVAKNYDAQAEEDDGTCLYAIKGCMDTMAINYDINAEEADETCTYIAPSEKQKRTVLLEEFTGVRCQSCPCGHAFVEEYKSMNPGKLISIGIQTSSTTYGPPVTPSAEDLRTTFSQAIEANAGRFALPTGSFNRGPYGEEGSPQAVVLTRQNWFDVADAISAEDAEINLGALTKYDEGSRNLEITVEAYFTTDLVNDFYINVVIVENDLEVPQVKLNPVCDFSSRATIDYGYIHHDVLRTFVTGQWGEFITSSANTGDRIRKQFSITLDNGWNPDNCKVIIFASQERSMVYNAIEVGVKE